MRISSFHIESFGIFHDLEVAEIPSNLVVLSGDNEAGKSTLLAFLRAVLFGFPRKNAALDRVYPALRGGRLGGRINLIRQDGEGFEIERLAGRNGSRPRVLSPDGSVDSDVQIESLLGVDETTFKTVFAFDLADLVRLRDEREEIQAILYGAGSGTGHLALPRAERVLEDRSKALFTPKGRKASINVAFKDLGRVQSELVRARAEADRYETTRRQLEAQNGSIATWTSERKQLRSEHRRLDRLALAWPDAIELRDARERLAKLESTIATFPEDGVGRWKKTGEEIEHLETSLKEKRRDLDELLEERDALEVEEALIEHGEMLDGLTQEIEPARRAYDRRQELRALLLEGDRAIRDDLASLGPDFSLQWIAEADPSLFARDEVRKAGQQLRDLEHQLDDLSQRLEEKKQRLGAVSHGFADRKNPDSEPPAAASGGSSVSSYRKWETDEDVRRGRSELRQLAELLRECDGLEFRVSSLQDESISGAGTSTPHEFFLWRRLAWAGALLLALGAVGAALGGFFGWSGVAWALGGLALVGLALVVVGVFLRPPENAPAPGNGDRGLAQVERELAEARTNASRLLRSLGSDAEPSWDVREEIEMHLQAAADHLAQAQTREHRLHEIEGEIGPLRQQLEDRKEGLDEARKSWRRWVAARGFPRELSPESALDSLERIESLQRRMREREDRQSEAAKLLERRDALFERIVQIFELLGLPLPDRAAWIPAIEKLRESLASSRENQAQRLQQARTMHRLEARIVSDLGELELLEATRALLMQTAKVDDGDDFLRLAATWEEARLLRRRVDELHPRILRSLEAEDLAAAEAQLAAQSREDLDSSLDELSARQEELEEILDRAKEERSSMQRELEELASSEQIARLRAEEEALITGIREGAEEWARYAITEHLIAEARAVYEREHQPRVLQTASRFFSTITGGYYPELLAPLGEKEILVVDSAGTRKSSNELSRGTEEQLYLALRFGFIRQMAEGREPLPVVMDDIMVNFDPHRASKAAAAIAELAREQQVLYFTCHPSTVELFRAEVGDLTELRLHDGGIERVS